MKRTLWTYRFSFLVGLTLIVCQASGCSQSSRNPIDPDNTIPDTGWVRIDVQPSFVLRAVPIYPQEALDNCLEGIVWIQVLINILGEVVDVRVAKDSGINAGLEQAAMDAAQKSTFSPEIRCGEPVEAWSTFVIEFVL